MRILADENMYAGVVEWLRETGHDVLWASETLGGTPDHTLLSLAFDQDRVVLTNDLDFGELVVRESLPAVGVILLRFKAASSGDVLERFIELWPPIEEQVEGRFIVVSNLGLRARLLSP